MFVKTRLIILHIDFKDGTHKCLLDNDGDIPCAEVIDNQQPIQCGPDLLEEYLIIKPDWVSFYLVDINVNDNILYIYYTCMIPNIIENKKGSWVDIGKINDDNGYVHKMVFEAGQKLLARF